MFIVFCFSVLWGCETPSVDHELSSAQPVDARASSKDTLQSAQSKENKNLDSENDARSGLQIYTQTCQTCHMSTGEGRAGINPPLAGSEWPLKEPSVPIRIVLHGLMGEIQVAGHRYNSVMSPWGNHFNDQEIANVLNYIRNSWGNQAELEITAEMVKEQRDLYPNKRMWTARELQ